MTIQQAIEKAIEGGYDGEVIYGSKAANTLARVARTKSLVAKDRELGNPYNSVSTWKEIGKNRGYWGFFKDQVISAREKELVEEVEKKSFRGFAPYEQDYLIKKEDVLSILKH